MPSQIYFKFKSYKEFSSIQFEGQSLPLWELKYEVVTQRKMNSKDFDLLFFDDETSEQLLDEYVQIPKNSHISIQRIPSWMSKTGFQLKEKRVETSASVSIAKKYFKDPPENYVCFRCGNKGHFIQHCPTNNDKTFDIMRVRKPSGIPRDFLRKVQSETDNANSMLATEDGFVVANPQTQEWKRQGERYNQTEGIPFDLKCGLCHGLLKEAMITNCGHRFCENCIVNEERCTICSKTVTNISFDENFKEKVKRFKSEESARLVNN
jgi:protein MPE1